MTFWEARVAYNRPPLRHRFWDWMTLSWVTLPNPFVKMWATEKSSYWPYFDKTLTKSQPTLSSPLPPPQPTVQETSLGVPASSEDHKLSEFPEIDTCADLLSTLHADGVPPQTSKAFQVSVTSLKQSGQNPSFSVKIQSGVVTISFFRFHNQLRMGILCFSPNYCLGQLVQDQGPIGSIHWACWKNKDSAQSIQAKREALRLKLWIVSIEGFWWKCLPRQF